MTIRIIIDFVVVICYNTFMQTKINYIEVICDGLGCGEQTEVESTQTLLNRGWEHIEFHTAKHITPRDYCPNCMGTDFAKERRSMFDSDFSFIDGRAVI